MAGRCGDNSCLNLNSELRVNLDSFEIIYFAFVRGVNGYFRGEHDIINKFEDKFGYRE